MDRPSMTRPGDQRTELCLRLADTAWSCFVITPLCVFYWSGTWKLVDKYIFPENNQTSMYISLGIGAPIGICGYLILPLMAKHVTPACEVKHIIISRVFTFIYAFGILNYWRGIWNIMDHFVGKHVTLSLVCFFGAVALLILLRALSSASSAPYTIAKDHRSDFYQAKPLFRSQVWIIQYLISIVGYQPAESGLCIWDFWETHLKKQLWEVFWKKKTTTNSSAPHSGPFVGCFAISHVHFWHGNLINIYFFSGKFYLSLHCWLMYFPLWSNAFNHSSLERPLEYHGPLHLTT